ncbi:MAG: hypothetical protein E7358_06675 [Clostridiales bacterium]|nr:hypothetical protein [Clostridiales bacterium]
MNKILKNILIGTCVAIITAGVFFIGFFTREWTFSDTQRAVINLLDKYEKYYFYKDDDVLDLIEDAILDKYSRYYTKTEYANSKNVARGENNGTGLVFYKDSLQIAKIALNSPCFHQGVKAGGTVISASFNGNTASGNYDEITNFIDSVGVGNTLELAIDYGGEIKTFSIKNQNYNETYVVYKNSVGSYAFTSSGDNLEFNLFSQDKISKSGVGYIKYTSFNGKKDNEYGSYTQLKRALDKFKQDGNKKLIFDLRGNGGGYLDILSKISGLLVEERSGKQVLASVKDRDGNVKNYYVENKLSSNYNFEKIIVLADINTASASEIILGALIDYDSQNKVSIVLDGYQSNGKIEYRTYGKGIMQNTYRNFDGSAVKLTVAKVYWPSGRCIHGTGVTSDISSKVINAENKSALNYALENLV